MVIKELLQSGKQILQDKNISSPQLDASLILGFVLEKNRTYLMINYAESVTDEQKKRYFSLINKRAEGMPVAYILGIKEFMSLDFIVNEKVLIPRPDTEILCEYVLKSNKKASPRILDVCCGSGCIGVSLASYIKDAHVTMVDISAEALSVAEQNAKKHNVYERCSFEKLDVLQQSVEGEFDIIVSNPPYIEKSTINTLQRDVAFFEPHIALDGGDDGLVFYRHLAFVLPDILCPGGMLAFEVGHTQAKAVMEMMKEKGLTQLGSECDLANIQRVVYGIKN